MINHVRTLLLNRDGDKRPTADFFGEELVPEDFRELALNSELDNLRAILFGTNPDHAGLNYRLWEYMRLLHSTEFEAYVLDLDPRVTYLSDKTLVEFAYGPSAAPVDSLASTVEITPVGESALGGAGGRLKNSWTLLSKTPSSVQVTDNDTGQFADQPVVFDSGLSDIVPMTNDVELGVRFGTEFEALPVDARWRVDVLNRPQLDMSGQAAGLVNLSGGIRQEIFPRREPFNTFRQLFTLHHLFPFQFSGVLLALAYRTEELRAA